MKLIRMPWTVDNRGIIMDYTEIFYLIIGFGIFYLIVQIYLVLYEAGVFNFINYFRFKIKK